MPEPYTYKVWGKDIRPFIDANIKPVYKAKVQGKKKKMLYGYWGFYYHDDARAGAERVMLERSGFTKVEVVTLKC